MAELKQRVMSQTKAIHLQKRPKDSSLFPKDDASKPSLRYKASYHLDPFISESAPISVIHI